MNLVTLGGSLLAVLALAGTARLLALGHRQPMSEDEAMREAEHMLAGYAARSAAVSRDGRTALVDGDGGAVLVREHGAHLVVRALGRPRARVDGDRLIVHTGERLFGETTLDLGAAEAARWAGRFGQVG